MTLIKQQMGQRRNLKRNQQISWEKENNISKLTGYSEISAMMKFVACIRKDQKPSFIPQETRQRTQTKFEASRRKGILGRCTDGTPTFF